MKVYTTKDGAQLPVGQAFALPDGTKFPSNWFDSATADDLARFGITVAIVPDPAPAVPQLVVTAAAFRALFTAAEKVAITAAGQSDVQLRIFMDDAGAADSVNLGAVKTTQGVAYLVSRSLLTQDRATAILAGTAPT